ncbi:PREDICTED: SPRY domain-containing SOCS box protein 3-like isoform X2 [Papilio polytes]|uniref:SPRY domain-containing SOCS box protein 3-like isoform X2 n=1 Tax=Papilio polytes TaxID=76194 RepID=UPI000675DABC|nr:PREDICTED: SPRY domain-containing SOCS box protein 3-like isoform X2 [Papilio polytes]
MLSRNPQSGDADEVARPFCLCWDKKEPVQWRELSKCSCGEEEEVFEWKWSNPEARSQVVMSDDGKQVTFHPYYSSGTAAVRGDTPLVHNNHYYWEVKMLSETYGTDIMVGIGSGKVPDSQYTFTSLLGQDSESYGLSYLGPVRHDAAEVRGSAGFCRGSIIGVRLDMWAGTLEFFINRRPQGVCIYNLRRHEALFPMICSTAAQSTMRLIYSASWRASLLVEAAKSLASSTTLRPDVHLPPGLWNTFKSHFWLTLPTEVSGDRESETSSTKSAESASSAGRVGRVRRRNWLMLPRTTPFMRQILL